MNVSSISMNNTNNYSTEKDIEYNKSARENAHVSADEEIQALLNKYGE